MKKGLTLTLVTGACLLLHFACKKADFPDNIQGNPVFNARFEFFGAADTLTAGEQGIYLFTRINRDDRNRYELTGSFAPADCPTADCPGTFTVKLRTRVVLDSSFSGGNYGYYWVDNPDTTLYASQLVAVPGFAGPYECLWTLRDSLDFVGPTVAYETTNPAPIRVRQDILQSDLFFSRIERQISPSGDNFCPNVNIATEQFPGDSTLRLSAVVTPTFTPLIAWSTGNDTYQIYENPSPGATYSVTVTNPDNGCTASAALRLADWVAGKRTSNFTVNIQTTDQSALNEAVIEWTDAQGKRWSSQLGPQPASARFEVLDVEPFEKNERGEPTRKFHIRFNCLLYNVALAEKQISGEAVVAVGWPG